MGGTSAQRETMVGATSLPYHMLPCTPDSHRVRVCVHRYFNYANYVVVKTTKQVDILLAAIAERLDENARSAMPMEYAEDYDDMYRFLGMQEAPEIHIKQECDDVTITGKTYSLSLFLNEIGFEVANGAFRSIRRTCLQILTVSSVM